jgi:hypothetical protein
MKIKLVHLIDAMTKLKWDITYREKIYEIEAEVQLTEESIQDGRLMSCLTISCDSTQGLMDDETMTRKITVFSSEDRLIPIMSTIKNQPIQITSSEEA